jgi:hypothetical protein
MGVNYTTSAELEGEGDEIVRAFREDCDSVLIEERSNAVEPNRLEDNCKYAAADIINQQLARQGLPHRVCPEALLIFEEEEGAFNRASRSGIANIYAGCAKVFRLPDEMPYEQKICWYISVMAHELVHLAPDLHISFRLNSNNQIEEGMSHSYRYVHQHAAEYQFRGIGLDEALVASFTMEACRNAVGLIFERFGVDISWFTNNEENFLYFREMRFMRQICETVSCTYPDFNYETMLATIFTGRKMHLRKFEDVRTFGPGAMRMLSLLGSDELRPIQEIKAIVKERYGNECSFHDWINSTNDYIFYYFETFSVSEQMEIEELLLAPKELEKIRRRRERVEANILAGGIRAALNGIIR